MASSTKKVVARIVAADRARQQKERDSLYLRDPSKVNRSASRMTPAPRKGSRAAKERAALKDFS